MKRLRLGKKERQRGMRRLSKLAASCSSGQRGIGRIEMALNSFEYAQIETRLPGEPGATEPESRGGDRQIIVKKGEKVNDEGSRK
jgi:hypothetical protein